MNRDDLLAEMKRAAEQAFQRPANPSPEEEAAQKSIQEKMTPGRGIGVGPDGRLYQQSDLLDLDAPDDEFVAAVLGDLQQ